MGSCVSSSHTNNSSASNPAVKVVALISTPDTTSSLTNDVITSATINSNPPLDSACQDSGNKDDEIIFFDSRGWLDSDSDDDFMSVAGEFTPSRGTTPLHHKFSHQPSQEQEVPSPTDNNKRLVELFKETQDEDEEDYVAEGKARTCLWLRTPVRSSAPATPTKERPLQLKRLHGGCVPRLVSCTSFTDRRRKMLTHTPIDVHR